LPKASAPFPAQGLNPVFTVEGQELVMATQYMAAVPEGELRFRVGSLAEQQDEISSALDMLFLGF
jgi:toxin CcdB